MTYWCCSPVGSPSCLSWHGGPSPWSGTRRPACAPVALIGDEMPEPEFRRLVDRSEALALLPPPDEPPSEFDLLVMQALDDLPEQFRELLERTPVVVSRRGREHHAYGHYLGGTIARDVYPDRIVIYEDTLERDFGHDP